MIRNPFHKNQTPFRPKAKHCLVAILICFLARNPLHAQVALTTSAFTEATTIPFTTFLNDPVHPGVQLGLSLPGKKGDLFRLYPAINVGYMFHNNLFQGVYGNVELGWDLETTIGLDLKSKVGLGYLHTFTTQDEYTFEDGAYIQKGDRGNSRVMPSISLGLGYRLNPKADHSNEIFMLYQSWLEYPYSPDFIPLMTHTSIHIGTRFYLKNND